MRPTIVTLVCAILLVGCAVIAPASQDDLQSIEVVEEHNLTQDEAFSRLVRWAAETYNSANDVIQLEDREAGSIVAKGAVQPPGSTVLMYYTMTMDIRDGRVRFRQWPGDARSTMGTGDYISKLDAEKLYGHFGLLRASAMAALEADDDF